jgi:spermidine synthase
VSDPEPPPRWLPPLFAVFFLSGATSLVYQSVWARDLHLLLGTSADAITVVLSAFMAGLGLGAVLGGRLTARVGRPLRTYALLELGIGGWALAFPHLVREATPLYVALGEWPGASVWRAGLAGALLLPPTLAMGATLPLLSRLVADRRGTVGDRVGQLYAANTAGAVFGTAAAGLFTLPFLGAAATAALSATGNFVLALGALVLQPRFPPPAVFDDLEEAEPGSILATPGVVWVAFLAGLAVLSCEISWSRLVGLILGGSTYAFTAMLLAVLLGVAVGGRIGGPLADDALRFGGTAAVLRGLAVIEGLVAAWLLLSLFLWPLLPYVFVWMFDAMSGRENPVAVFGASFCTAVLVLLVPSTLSGVAFPFAIRAAVGGSEEVAGPVGRVYGANTLGGVLGAALTGFVVLPVFGLQACVAVAASLHLFAAAGALRFGRSGTRAAVVALAAAGALFVRAPWNPMWMSGGMYQYVSRFSDHTMAGIERFALHDQELLFYDEGRSTVVTVGRNVSTGNLWLANNGKIDASTSGDLPTQVLASLIGAQHSEKLDRALVIGLASGITAGALTTVPTLRQLEVAELEAAVVEASALFREHNHDLLANPRVTVVANDGRNHLLRAPPGTYDLVVSEPSNPYLSGVANLFTEEFWRLGRSRLVPGGVWAQWLQLYGMGPSELRGLMGTFADVFPEVAVYVTIEGADLVLVGSDRPIVPRPELAARLLAAEPVKLELERIGIRFPLDLVALHAMNRAQALAFAGDARRVTDDNLLVEYAAPIWLHTDIAIQNWDDLYAASEIPWEVIADPLDWFDLADSYDQVGHARRANQVRERLLAHLPPGDPLRAEVEAQRDAAEEGEARGAAPTR